VWKLKNELLSRVIEEVGSVPEVAKRCGYSVAYLRNLMYGVADVSIKGALKLSELSNGKIRPEQFRPEIFEYYNQVTGGKG
jgi:hypothetical protein